METLKAFTEQRSQRLHLQVAWLCGVVLFLEGYDIAAVGYAIPSLVDAWGVRPAAFTQALTAGNVGLLLGSLAAGLLGDRLGRKPVLISCVAVFGIFSLLTALAGSPLQLAELRFVTGLGLGGGLPLAIALASDFAPQMIQERFVILTTIAIPVGFTVGGFLTSQLVHLVGWPAIFILGGLLPLMLLPLLALNLPESDVMGLRAPRRNLAGALFQKGLASTTALLWTINLLSLLAIYLILLWTPAILHSAGASPARAILGTTMYALGVIVSPLLTAFAIGRIQIEIVLTYGLAFGALCVLLIGLFNPPFWLLAIVICGAGMGGGCQGGINALLGLVYPAAIRSTGAGWGLAAGRVGTIAGPLLGGVLLARGLEARQIFIAAAIPVFGAALLTVWLGQVRRKVAKPESN